MLETSGAADPRRIVGALEEQNSDLLRMFLVRTKVKMIPVAEKSKIYLQSLALYGWMMLETKL